MLFEESEEFGTHTGLGVLGGRVLAIPRLTTNGVQHRIPHIGWNHLIRTEFGRSWTGSLLEKLDGQHPAVYFVHSFAAVPQDPSIRLADTNYGGHKICAAVQKDNVMATQFHPERSGEIGLEIINSFSKI